MRTFTSVLARTALAATIVAGSALAAQAEVVFHRGNTGEPETLDQHRTSTTYEAQHPVRTSMKVSWPSTPPPKPCPARRKAGPSAMTVGFTPSPSAKTRNGRMATRSPPMISSISLQRILNPATGAKYANILYPIENAEDGQHRRSGTQRAQRRRPGPTGPWKSLWRRRRPYFLELLTHQTGLPVHQASVESNCMATISSSRGIWSATAPYRPRRGGAPGPHHGGEERVLPRRRRASRSTRSTTIRSRTARRLSGASRPVSCTPTTTCPATRSAG